ncbi:MAG: carbon starvation protein A, partial [Selenomonadaceae bacterium]|nr:carbon starvation protein A [Selenomonadaceae bacterium]
TGTRLSRFMFSELFLKEDEKTWQEAKGIRKLLAHPLFGTTLMVVIGCILGGLSLSQIWGLFGAANQLLSSLVLISLAVFLRTTGRKGWMLYVPMTFMFIVTMTALVMSAYGIVTKLGTGNFVPMVDGLQLVLALALMTLAVLVVQHCGKELAGGKEQAARVTAE